MCCGQGEEEEEEEEESDHDQVLIDAVAELLGEVAKTFKEGFAPHFAPIFALLEKYFKPTRQASDRFMAIGAVAETCANLGCSCVCVFVCVCVCVCARARARVAPW